MLAHLGCKRLARLTSYSVRAANGPTGNDRRQVSRDLQIGRAGHLREQRQPWDAGVAKADGALSVMLS